MTRPSDRAIAQAFAEFQEATTAVPLGHYDGTKGSSTYNWRRSFESAVLARAAELDATAAPVVVGEDAGLLKFVAEVMEDWHEGDLDGGDRQDLAEKYGLLIPVEVTESCGEYCGCSEYGDFPLTCYRPSPVLLRCRAALTAALAGD